MSDKVVTLPMDRVRLSEEIGPDDNYIWQCGCGGRKFELLKGGILVCTSCEEYKPEVTWGFVNQDQM